MLPRALMLSSVASKYMCCASNDLETDQVSNTSAVDTCCFNYPGGKFLSTQFWDTAPPTGVSMRRVTWLIEC